jgi:peptidoglycan/LPS O-acetylase OafA/YrhL
VRFYTRDLPAEIAERRVGEIDADLHDHIAHERANGIGERRIARRIASRMVRGLAADASWRRQQSREEKMNNALYRSARRVAIGVALILLVPLVVTLTSDGEAWSVWDFVAAGVFLAGIGVVIELAVKRMGNLALAIGLAVVGVLAGVAGEADDAPGLVLLGIVLVVSACALGVRSRTRPPQHSR